MTTTQVATTISELRRALCALHAELPAHGLVVWTSGNVSARVPGADLMLIKPSGLQYSDLTPRFMVLCDLDGTVVEGTLQPSSDAAAHALIYRSMPGINGVAHTHSPYATAWAAAGRAIPCVLTAMADEFGGEIPLAPFALIGDAGIGELVVQALTGHNSPAVLLKNHGVFTIGASARDAVKAAIMCEDAARTVAIAESLGTPELIPADDVAALHARYQNVYGQR